MQPTYRHINFAFQLHYYLAFQTYSRRERFVDQTSSSILAATTEEVCQRLGYQLLKSKIYPEHFRCLLSLRPDQDISTVLEKLKTNTSRECGRYFRVQPPFWARGYLARTVGRVQISRIKQYIADQAEHHGYSNRPRAPVYRYQASSPTMFKLTHSDHKLNYHVVLATRFRTSILDSIVGRELGQYWLRVADKYGFAIDRTTILPDHTHLLVRSVPKTSIETCVLTLMNNGDYFVRSRYPLAFKGERIDQLWQPSAYVGTCGEVTTAMVKAWLNSPALGSAEGTTS